jgi:hypothetical protein
MNVTDNTEWASCSAGHAAVIMEWVSTIIDDLPEGVIVSVPPAGTEGGDSSHHKHSVWFMFQFKKNIGMSN